MARRRYQRGHMYVKGTRERKWYIRWLDDVVENGEVKRVCRNTMVGTMKEFPTRRLAYRQAEVILAGVNNPTYQAKTEITFQSVAMKWMEMVMPNHKPASIASETGHLKRHLLPYFGGMRISDINVECVQRFVSTRQLSPKTVRNVMDTFRLVWKSAKAWGYAEKDVYITRRGEENITLPRLNAGDQPVYSLHQMKQIIAEAREPYKTLFWIVAETGIRGGEVCGLALDDIDLKLGVIIVRRSTWRGNLQTPKTANATRCFPISASLVDHISRFIASQAQPNANGLLFCSRDGTPLDNSNVVKYALRPVTDRLGLPPAGLHALRHGNATELDRMGAPVAVRRERLGHAQFTTTLRYTHAVSKDHRDVADNLGRLLTGSMDGAGMDVRSTGTRTGGDNTLLYGGVDIEAIICPRSPLALPPSSEEAAINETAPSI